MRLPVPWVSATTFGLVGFLLAAVIAVSAFGWHWIFLPAALASAAAVYEISTWLGGLAARDPHGLLPGIGIGIAIALATLIAGVIAFGFVNALLSWIEVVTGANLRLGVVTSVFHAIRAYVLAPLVGVLFYGGWIAVILGIAYGLLLYIRGKRRHAHVA